MAKKKKNKELEVPVTAPRNYVAKHMNTFNHATVEVDRKKEAKKDGFANKKHRNRDKEDY